MSRLRGYSRSMSEVFEETITVRYIASSLASFDAERTAYKIRDWMIRKEYDQIGVRRDGVVVGYAMRDDLGKGRLGDHLREFAEHEVVSAQKPMLEGLELIQNRRRIFVSILGEVNGIVTASDVVKPPVRLWLFGLVMIFEMQVSRLIRARYPDGAWMARLPAHKLDKGKKAQGKLLALGTEMDLADCLELSDKQKLLVETRDLVSCLGLESQESATQVFNRVRALRNSLAHVHDISGQWPWFLGVAREIEQVIAAAESISRRTFRALGGPDGLA